MPTENVWDKSETVYTAGTKLAQNFSLQEN